MKTEAQKQAQARYQKKCKTYTIVCYPNDADIVAHLESKKATGGNHNGYSTYIKELIRKDIFDKQIAPKLDKVAEMRKRGYTDEEICKYLSITIDEFYSYMKDCSAFFMAVRNIQPHAK